MGGTKEALSDCAGRIRAFSLIRRLPSSVATLSMCLVVFAGSSAPVPLVEWTDASPGFNVRTLAPHEEAVRCVLAFPHLARLVP